MHIPFSTAADASVVWKQSGTERTMFNLILNISGENCLFFRGEA